jgi:outer membrane protein assembly factor BamB
MYVSNGEEPKPAVKFLPPNANAHGLVVFDNHAYVATSNGCGGVADGLWMMNLDTQKVDHWKASSSKVAGPAIGPDGTLYVSSGSELVALEPKTLRVKGKFSAGKVHFASMPVVFAWRDQDIVAAATNDGRLHILDAAKLDKPLASSRPFSSPDQEIKALATWVDPAGERWILAPAGGAISLAGFRSTNGPVTDGAIVAWKVVDKAGTAGLEPGWVSPNMTAPKTPLIINGVVFALAAGKPNGPHATLYALDATTGKDVWSSGEAIHSFVSSGGLSAGSTRVYLSTHDGVQYAFGFPIETLD